MRREEADRRKHELAQTLRLKPADIEHPPSQSGDSWYLDALGSVAVVVLAGAVVVAGIWWFAVHDSGSSTAGSAICQRIETDRAAAKASLDITLTWDQFSSRVDDLNGQADAAGCDHRSVNDVAAY